MRRILHTVIHDEAPCNLALEYGRTFPFKLTCINSSRSISGSKYLESNFLFSKLYMACSPRKRSASPVSDQSTISSCVLRQYDGRPVTWNWLDRSCVSGGVLHPHWIRGLVLGSRQERSCLDRVIAILSANVNFIIVATLLSETLSATMLLALCLILWRIFVASSLMRRVLTQDSALSRPRWRAHEIAVCDRLKTSH